MPKYWWTQIFSLRRFPEVGQKQKTNTPGTAGGPGGRDRTLAVKNRKTAGKKNYLNKYFFLHISSSYAKILGEKLFRTWEFPRSGSKAEDGGKRGERERKKERKKD